MARTGPSPSAGSFPAYGAAAAATGGSRGRPDCPSLGTPPRGAPAAFPRRGAAPPQPSAPSSAGTPPLGSSGTSRGSSTPSTSRSSRARPRPSAFLAGCWGCRSPSTSRRGSSPPRTTTTTRPSCPAAASLPGPLTRPPLPRSCCSVASDALSAQFPATRVDAHIDDVAQITTGPAATLVSQAAGPASLLGRLWQELGLIISPKTVVVGSSMKLARALAAVLQQRGFPATAVAGARDVGVDHGAGRRARPTLRKRFAAGLRRLARTAKAARTHRGARRLARPGGCAQALRGIGAAGGLAPGDRRRLRAKLASAGRAGLRRAVRRDRHRPPPRDREGPPRHHPLLPPPGVLRDLEHRRPLAQGGHPGGLSSTAPHPLTAGAVGSGQGPDQSSRRAVDRARLGRRRARPRHRARRPAVVLRRGSGPSRRSSPSSAPSSGGQVHKQIAASSTAARGLTTGADWVSGAASAPSAGAAQPDRRGDSTLLELGLCGGLWTGSGAGTAPGTQPSGSLPALPWVATTRTTIGSGSARANLGAAPRHRRQPVPRRAAAAGSTPTTPCCGSGGSPRSRCLPGSRAATSLVPQPWAWGALPQRSSSTGVVLGTDGSGGGQLQPTRGSGDAPTPSSPSRARASAPVAPSLTLAEWGPLPSGRGLRREHRPPGGAPRSHQGRSSLASAAGCQGDLRASSPTASSAGADGAAGPRRPPPTAAARPACRPGGASSGRALGGNTGGQVHSSSGGPSHLSARGCDRPLGARGAASTDPALEAAGTTLLARQPARRPLRWARGGAGATPLGHGRSGSTLTSTPSLSLIAATHCGRRPPHRGREGHAGG